MPYQEKEADRAARRTLGPAACGFFDPAQIPGYVEAIKDENFLWDSAFLGMDEKICGFYARPLTTQHLLWLSVVQSPFLLSARPEFYYLLPGIDNHVKRFMWIVSPWFKPEGKWRRKLFFFIYNRLIGPQRGDKVIQEIQEYVLEAFRDFRRGPSSDNFCSIAAANIHFLCSRYCFTMEQALSCPLKIVFQLQQCARMENSRHKVIKKSDELIAQWLESENQKLRAKIDATR